MRIDLHLRGVGQPDDHLLLAHLLSLRDDRVGAVAGRHVRVNHLAGFRRPDGTLLDLLLGLVQLLQVEAVAGLLRFELGLGRLDVGVELAGHLLPGELLEHHELGFARVERVAGLLDGETVGLELQLGDVALGGQLFAVGEVIDRAAEVLLGDDDLLLDLLHLDLVRPFEVLLLRNDGRVVVVLRLDDGRLAVVADDLLLGQLALQRGRIEPDDEIAFLDGGSLGHDFEDGGAGGALACHFAADFDVVGAFDVAVLGDLVDELAALDRTRDHARFRRRKRHARQREPRRQRRRADDRHHHGHAPPGEPPAARRGGPTRGSRFRYGHGVGPFSKASRRKLIGAADQGEARTPFIVVAQRGIVTPATPSLALRQPH